MELALTLCYSLHAQRNSSSSVQMSSAASPKSILHLYASMLRTSRSFSSYNFREYFVRRTKSIFRDIQVCPLD